MQKIFILIIILTLCLGDFAGQVQKIFVNEALNQTSLSDDDINFLEGIEYNDYIIYRNSVYINIDENPYKENYMERIKTETGGELIKTFEIGSVTNRKEAESLDLLSSVLPTGTQIFKYYVSTMIILAELDGELIVYCIDSNDSESSTYSPIVSDRYSDYFIIDRTPYVNITDNEYWSDKNFNYIKGDYIGKVLANSDERNVFKVDDFTANLLPIGTKLYKFDEYPAIILADTADGLIPYLEIREG
jgi:hypothetical protein